MFLNYFWILFLQVLHWHQNINSLGIIHLYIIYVSYTFIFLEWCTVFKYYFYICIICISICSCSICSCYSSVNKYVLISIITLTRFYHWSFKFNAFSLLYTPFLSSAILTHFFLLNLDNWFLVFSNKLTVFWFSVLFIYL